MSEKVGSGSWQVANGYLKGLAGLLANQDSNTTGIVVLRVEVDCRCGVIGSGKSVVFEDIHGLVNQSIDVGEGGR